MAQKTRKKTRRLKGTGSVFHSPRLGKYVGRVIVGRHPNGKPKYAQRSSDTAEGLRHALAEVKPPGATTTVGEWLDRWLGEMVCKPGTRRNRTAAVTYHLKPTLGHLKVATVTPRDIEVAAGRWRQTSNGGSVPLHPNTARNYLSTLGTALRAAVRANLRPDNPVRSAQKPRGVKVKIDPFTAAEMELIATEAAKAPNTRAFAVIAATGLRAGECLALDCPDVDTRAGTVAVTKTLDSSDRTVLGTPKSPNSRRTIRVPAEPAAALGALRAAVGGRTSGPVFRTRSGLRVVYGVLYDAWRVLLNRLGLRYRGVHQLRHGVASHMLAAGVDVAEVAAYLGDTPAEILKTYSHAVGRTDPAEAMERYYRGLRGDNKVTGGGAKRAGTGKNKAKRGK